MQGCRCAPGFWGSPAMHPVDPWIESFMDELAAVPSGVGFTNFYSSEEAANELRRHNLSLYLREMGQRKPTVLLVGEAPGHRGTRVTGVPFADRRLLIEGVPSLSMFGRLGGYRLPHGGSLQPIYEQTSTVVWQSFARHQFVPLLWAAFPFHPYSDRGEGSNRAPRQTELELGQRFLQSLLDAWPVEQVLAVGRVAEKTLRSLGFNCAYIRHPARGGQREFDRGIAKLANDNSVHKLRVAQADSSALSHIWPSGFSLAD